MTESPTVTKGPFHTPGELLAVADKMLASGDPALNRPAVLEAITCLETYIQRYVFRSLRERMDPLLVDWLEARTRTDFDARLSVLTPIASNHPIDTRSSLWTNYKKAREIRHKVVHSGLVVSRADAQFVRETVHDWLAYLASSVGLEVHLRDLKTKVESASTSPATELAARDIVVAYFGERFSVGSQRVEPRGTSPADPPQVLLFDFGKYRIAVYSKITSARSLSAVFEEPEAADRGRKISGSHSLPEQFTHGVRLFFVRDRLLPTYPPISWSADDRIVTVLIHCAPTV